MDILIVSFESHSNCSEPCEDNNFEFASKYWLIELLGDLGRGISVGCEGLHFVIMEPSFSILREFHSVGCDILIGFGYSHCGNTLPSDQFLCINLEVLPWLM